MSGYPRRRQGSNVNRINSSRYSGRTRKTPFKKSTSFKKRPYTRSVVSNRSKSAVTTSMLKSMMSKISERKFVDFFLGDTNMVTGGVLYSLSTIATGNDFTNRIGRQIDVQNVTLRVVSYQSTSNAGGTIVIGTTVRVLLVWDEQPNLVLASTADLFFTGASGNIDSTSMMNLNNRARFHILADEFFDLSNTAGVSFHQFNVYRNINKKTEYAGTAANTNTISTGGLCLVILDTNGASMTPCAYSFNARVIFTDP